MNETTVTSPSELEAAGPWARVAPREAGALGAIWAQPRDGIGGCAAPAPRRRIGYSSGIARTGDTLAYPLGEGS
jgi:hypothetical protein